MPWPFTFTSSTSSSSINPLTLPEISVLIRSYLDRSSLLACCRLNRAFYNGYILYLTWDSVNLTRFTLREKFPRQLLYQHEGLIRRLIIEDTGAFFGWTFTHCKNLIMLDLRIDSRNLDDDWGRDPDIREVGYQILQLVRQNMGLKDLRINWDSMSMQHRNMLNRDLEHLHCRSLVTLTLTDATIEFSVINVLIDNCPQLQELVLERYCFYPSSYHQMVLELKHVKKLMFKSISTRRELAIIGPNVQELSLHAIYHSKENGPIWSLPSLGSLTLENCEIAILQNLAQCTFRGSLSKVRLRNMIKVVESLTMLAEYYSSSIRELVMDRDSMWAMSQTDRHAILQKLTNLEKFNGRDPQSWSFSVRFGCIVN
ncbi:hypothetical protein FBU30_004465 [Linnemannia zychae]|nr:hypothetical protein FBU30_004465 [Linnemannia zychae]